MAFYERDQDLMDPVLEIWVDDAVRPTTLRCAGRLGAGTRHAVLDAVAELLATGPRRLVVDVSDLEVADSEGAGTLVQVQRMVREAGAAMAWRGVSPASRAS